MSNLAPRLNLDNVSELQNPPVRRRRRRADADRSVAAILEAAIALLNRQPEATMEEIAAAAGVARQTVYAHFPTRQTLYEGILDRITIEASAALDDADLGAGPVTEALRRWLDITWNLIDRYPVLLDPQLANADPVRDRQRHEPISFSLLRLIDRGQRDGAFDPRAAPDWLFAATMALGHAAAQQARVGRMTVPEAGTAFRDSVLRLYGVGR